MPVPCVAILRTPNLWRPVGRSCVLQQAASSKAYGGPARLRPCGFGRGKGILGTFPRFGYIMYGSRLRAEPVT